MLPVAILRSDNPNDLTHKTYTGLLDTGATSSWISPKVIDALGLVELMKERVSFALDQQIATVYLFRVGLFDDQSDRNAFPFVFAETRGFKLHQRDDFDVILGMDILAQGKFAMSPGCEWLLEF